jgi:hypothetical protein
MTPAVQAAARKLAEEYAQNVDAMRGTMWEQRRNAFVSGYQAATSARDAEVESARAMRIKCEGREMLRLKEIAALREENARLRGALEGVQAWLHYRPNDDAITEMAMHLHRALAPAGQAARETGQETDK